MDRMFRLVLSIGILVSLMYSCIFSEDNSSNDRNTPAQVTVTGSVTDTTGTGVSGVRLDLISATDTLTATTNSAGQYSFSAVEPGVYTVIPSLANHTFTPSSRNITVGEEQYSAEPFTCITVSSEDSQPGIFGMIHDNLGDPLPDATITITQNGTQGQTDKEGSFAFLNVATGTYTIVPVLAGYTFYPPYAEVSIYNDDARADFVGVPTGSAGVTVTGTILDTDGRGVPGIECSLTSAANRFAATTDESGACAFYGVPPATYGLLPISAGYTYVPEYLTVTVGDESVTCDPVTAVPSGCNCSFDVFGSVKDRDGAAIADATVTLNPSGISVITDKEGSYFFADVLPGSYTITPALEGYAFTPLSLPVAVTAGNVRADFTGIARTEGYLITGRIIDTDGYPVPGLEISCTGASGRTTDTTSADGYYLFSELNPGAYQLLPITLPDTTFTPEFQTVTIMESDMEAADFVVSTTQTGSQRIIGRVVDAAGNGMADVTVVLLPAYVEAVTDKEGGYVFNGLEDSIYLVSAVLEGWQFNPPLVTVTIDGADVVVANIVGTESGGSDTYAVYGMVVDGSGEPLADVTVTLSPGGLSGTTDKEGGYYFASVAPGQYVVTPAMGDVTFTPSSYNVTVSNQPVNVPLFIGSGGGGGGDGIRVYGRITKADGSGVPDVLIQLAGGDVELSMNTDDTGNYTFSGIPNGEYVIVPVPSMQQAYSPPVMLITVAGVDVEANFTVQGSGDDELHAITVRSTDNDGAPLQEVLVTLGGGPTAVEEVTDESGMCVFTGLESGDYTVSPLKRGWTFNPPLQFVTITNTDATAEFTGTRESETAYAISGHVVSDTGAGVHGVRIMVNSVELGLPAGTALTMPDGQYVVTDLFPGEFVVLPSKEGYSFTPDQLTVTIESASVSLEDILAIRTDIPEEATVSTTVSMSGATLSVRNHRGDIIDLEFPPRSLILPEMVTLTTLVDPPAHPLSTTTFPGVRIEPDGLLLNRPAKLTVTFAEPPEEAKKNTLFWSLADDYVLPIADQEYSGDTIQGEIYHFSEYAGGIGTRDEISTQIQMAALTGIPLEKLAAPASAKFTWQGSYTQVKGLMHWADIAMTLGDEAATKKALDEAKKASEETIDDFLDEVIQPADPCDDYFETIDKLLVLATKLGAEGSDAYNRGVKKWEELYDQCKVRMILEIDYHQVMNEDDYHDDMRYQGSVTFYAPYFGLEEGEDFGKLEGGGTCLLQGTGSSDDCTWTKAGTVNIDLKGNIMLDDQGASYLELTLTEEYEYSKTTICPDQTWTQDIGFSSEPYTIQIPARKDETINESKTISGTTMTIRYTLRIPE